MSENPNAGSDDGPQQMQGVAGATEDGRVYVVTPHVDGRRGAAAGSGGTRSSRPSR